MNEKLQYLLAVHQRLVAAILAYEAKDRLKFSAKRYAEIHHAAETHLDAEDQLNEIITRKDPTLEKIASLMLEDGFEFSEDYREFWMQLQALILMRHMDKTHQNGFLDLLTMDGIFLAGQHIGRLQSKGYEYDLQHHKSTLRRKDKSPGDVAFLDAYRKHGPPAWGKHVAQKVTKDLREQGYEIGEDMCNKRIRKLKDKGLIDKDGIINEDAYQNIQEQSITEPQMQGCLKGIIS